MRGLRARELPEVTPERPCCCGATRNHLCDHCHDDPPEGHTCPACGAVPRAEWHWKPCG